MMQLKDLNWLFKCMQCKNYCQVQADANAVGCRLKDCRYEPSDEKIHELQRELAEVEK